MKYIAFVAALLALATQSQAQDEACYPTVDMQAPQFIVGYGSLMQTESRTRSSPTAGLGHPVLVTGFQRAWNARGSDVGYSTTYLGAVIADDPNTEMAAVLYKDPNASDIAGTDAREDLYCRHMVPPDRIRLLDGWELPDNANVWVYALTPDNVHLPNERWPIVQSYVDIFISGCMELEALVLPSVAQNMSFTQACIHQTEGWSEHWVNDRIYPRRPFIYQPRAEAIDKILSQELPEYFEKIVIE